MVNRLSKALLLILLLATVARADMTMWPAGSNASPSATQTVTTTQFTAVGNVILTIPTTTNSIQKITIAGTTSISIPVGAFNGQTLLIRDCQNSTGNYIVTWGATGSVVLRGSLPNNPTLKSNSCDTLYFDFDNQSSTCTSPAPCWFLDWIDVNQ